MRHLSLLHDSDDGKCNVILRDKPLEAHHAASPLLYDSDDGRCAINVILRDKPLETHHAASQSVV